MNLVHVYTVMYIDTWGWEFGALSIGLRWQHVGFRGG